MHVDSFTVIMLKILFARYVFNVVAGFGAILAGLIWNRFSHLSISENICKLFSLLRLQIMIGLLGLVIDSKLYWQILDYISQIQISGRIQSMTTKNLKFRQVGTIPSSQYKPFKSPTIPHKRWTSEVFFLVHSHPSPVKQSPSKWLLLSEHGKKLGAIFFSWSSWLIFRLLLQSVLLLELNLVWKL